MKKWDQRFIDMAKLVATWSKDPSTKVGSVIVTQDRRVVAVGFNGFPREVNDDPARYEDRMVKYKLIVHAEANAILNASRSVEGCTLYSTKFPCSDCAKLICQTGIYSVVSPARSTAAGDPALERWVEDAQFSYVMMSEAGVHISEF